MNRLLGKLSRTRFGVELAPSVVVFALLLLVHGVAWAATRTWDNDNSDGLWSEATNWSDDTKPTSADNAVFDATSTDACTVDEDFNVVDLTITADYSGQISFGATVDTVTGNALLQGTDTLFWQTSTVLFGGNVITGAAQVFSHGTATTERNSADAQKDSLAAPSLQRWYDYNQTGALTVATKAFFDGDFSRTGGGALTLSAGIQYADDMLIDGAGNLTLPADTVRGTGASGQLHVGSTVGTVSAGNTVLRFDGTTGMVLDDDKGITVNQLIFGEKAKATSSGVAISSAVSKNTDIVPLILLDSAQFTINRQIYIDREIQGGAMYAMGAGALINGSATKTFRTHAGSYELPALTVGGTGKVQIVTKYSTTGDNTFTQTGDIVIASELTLMRIATVAGVTTVNRDGYLLSVGGDFSFGNNRPLGVFYGDFTGDIVVGGNINSAAYDSGTTVIKGTPNMTVGGNLTWQSTHIDSTTGSIYTLNGAGTQTVTSAAKWKPDSIACIGSGTVALADSAYARSINVASGTLSHVGMPLRCDDFVARNGATVRDTGGTFYFTGDVDYQSGSVRYPSTGSITTKWHAVGGSGIQKLTLNGNVLPTFRVNNTGATLELQDSIRFNDTLYLIAGAFDQNGKAVHTNNLSWQTTDATTTLDGNLVLGIATRTAPSAGTHSGTMYMRSLGNVVSNGHRWHVMLVENTSTVTLSDIGAFDSVFVDAGSALITGASGDTLDACRIGGTLNTSGDIVLFKRALTFLAMSGLTIDGTTEHWFTGDGAVLTSTAGMTHPITVFWDNHRVIGGTTLGRLRFTGTDLTGTYEGGQTFIISTMGAGDWNGAAGRLNKLRSTVTGTHFTFNVPAGSRQMQYMNPRDTWITGGDIVYVNSVSGGGNR